MVDDDLMHTAAVMAPRHAALSGSLSLLPVRPSAADDGARVANGRSHGVGGGDGGDEDGGDGRRVRAL